MKKKTYIIYSILIFIMGSEVAGQDPQFSQFYSNPLYLAPSFAGLVVDTRATVNYRSQWLGVAQPYNTFSLGVDHNFHEFNSGFGVFLLGDQAGSGKLTTTTLSLLYAYEFNISQYWFIRPGVEFKYTQRRIDFTKLLWADQISASGNTSASSELPPEDHVGDIDAGTSLMAYSDKFWFGFGVDHLLEPNQSLYSLDGQDANDNPIGYVPVKYTIFGGTKIINKGRLVNPYDASVQIAVLYRVQEGYNQLDLGLYWYNKPIVLGVWYRGMARTREKISRDALILMAGFKMEQFNFGYSYDFTISNLLGSTTGSHEVSMTVQFETKVKKQKLRSVPCPDF